MDPSSVLAFSANLIAKSVVFYSKNGALLMSSFNTLHRKLLISSFI